MLLQLTELSEHPFYKQLTAQLTERILSGELPKGSRLPSVGEMARKYRVNLNTVKRAYRELEKDGFVRYRGDDKAVIASPPSEQDWILPRQGSVRSPGTTTFSFFEPLEKREFEEQLFKVHQLQENLLPKKLPENESISVAVYCHPSHIVGGDFYDCIQIDEHRYGLVIADACGNGLPAAMLISQTQAMLKSELNNGHGLQHILEHMNRQIVQNSPKDKFVTLFFGVIDVSSGEFQYVNAGHHYPILMRRTGIAERLDLGGLALGMFFDATYEVGQATLRDGDVLLLFTDGLTENMNALHQEYGEQRLVVALARYQHRNAQDMLCDILKDVRTFAQAKTRQDDCTLMIVRFSGISLKTSE